MENMSLWKKLCIAKDFYISKDFYTKINFFIPFNVYFHLLERHGDRGGLGVIFHPLVLSLNNPNSRGWARRKPGSPLLAGPTLESSAAALQYTLAGGWMGGGGCGTRTGTLVWAVGIPSSGWACCTTTQAPLRTNQSPLTYLKSHVTLSECQ